MKAAYRLGAILKLVGVIGLPLSLRGIGTSEGVFPLDKAGLIPYFACASVYIIWLINGFWRAGR